MAIPICAEVIFRRNEQIETFVRSFYKNMGYKIYLHTGGIIRGPP
jgi:hypothetical protein